MTLFNLVLIAVGLLTLLVVYTIAVELLLRHGRKASMVPRGPDRRRVERRRTERREDEEPESAYDGPERRATERRLGERRHTDRRSSPAA